MNDAIGLEITPSLGGDLPAFLTFCKRLSKALVAEKADVGKLCIAYRRELRDDSIGTGTRALRLLAAKSVVLDLVAQGQRLLVRGDKVRIISVDDSKLSPEEIKKRVREAHLVNRREQLQEPSTQAFIKGLEKLRLTKNGWRSIFSLMRDGREFSAKLRAVSALNEEQITIEDLRKISSPYLEFVEPDSVCQFTGIRLQEIWRYFRHTWITEYKSLPGRSIQILVRDSAAPNHPVIGIAALGSAVVQHTKRDQWIGWDSDTLLEHIRKNPTTQWSSWIVKALDNYADSIYTKDLRERGIISLLDIKYPNEDAIVSLKRAAAKAIEQHRRFPHSAAQKQKTDKGQTKIDWKAQAETNLFKSKRCEALARLLEIRMVLVERGFKKGTAKELRAALEHADFCKAIKQLSHWMKAEKVGSSIMDIIVCGAIAPYGPVLGGKLVCTLMFSPEIIRYYKTKYKDQESVIASAVKGKPVTKAADLVLLGTTSLFGVGSSQYNRMKIPIKSAFPETDEDYALEFVNLGVTKGYGSFHFSKDTIELFDLFLAREKGGRKVNSIFGEGVNPLMRKIRNGLSALKLPTGEFLNHGNKRIVYGIPLARNFSNVLLGVESRPKYLVPQKDRKAQQDRLANFWLKRWVVKRAQQPEVVASVAQHSLVYPIEHGARVELPTDDEMQLDLGL